MRKISTDLPFSYRLDLKLVKRRVENREPENLLPSLKKIANSRSGNKVSRYFRHIFEHKHIRRLLGPQIALMIVASSILPIPTSEASYEPEAVILSSEDVSIKTEAHIQYPLKNIKINQGYFFFHPGIDFEGRTGDSVRPIMAGEVEMIQYSKYAYGNAIIIRHGDSFSTLYAHLSKIYVKKGDKVTFDTIIGEVGSTGRSSGDHLHLEIRENGRAVNPFSMLPKL